VYSKINQEVLGILLDKYQLMSHLEALKRYLLLGQGDFIQNLMDLLGYEAYYRTDLQS
jgi:gamma-tubulin complex component 3